MCGVSASVRQAVIHARWGMLADRRVSFRVVAVHWCQGGGPTTAVLLPDRLELIQVVFFVHVSKLPINYILGLTNLLHALTTIYTLSLITTNITITPLPSAIGLRSFLPSAGGRRS